MTILSYLDRYVVETKIPLLHISVCSKKHAEEACLCRTNLAFAALQLNQQLGFTDYIYGLGSSVFFISYSLCQVIAPTASNVCLELVFSVAASSL